MTTARFILFRIGGETFLADVMTVRQIVPWSRPGNVPNAPALLEGLLVIGDQAVPVIDLATQFSGRAASSAGHPLIMLLESRSGVLALKVDEVKRILPLDLDEIVAAPPLVQGLAGEFLAGIVLRDEGQYLILDLDQLLSAETHRQLRELRDLHSAEARA